MAKYQECQPNVAFTFNDDGPFEELDPKELNGIGIKIVENGKEMPKTMEKRKSMTEEQIDKSGGGGCRRRRIAEKIAGIGASWKNRRSKVDSAEIEETKSTQGSGGIKEFNK
jgi:hypothetical protein